MTSKSLFGLFIEHDRHTFATTGPSMTHQAHKKECDINNIMAKWEKSGVLEHRNNYQGQYGDFLHAPQDYQTAVNDVMAAEEMFGSLPAKIRARFGNSPHAFLDFVHDPENDDEMIKMGLKIPSQIDVLENVETTPKKPSKVEKSTSSTPPESE